MDKNAIKKFAVWARTELIARVSLKGVEYGITEGNIEDANVDSVGGKVLTVNEKKQRKALIAEINDKGYKQVMEEVAYTWFNRFSALRFMEVNGYLPSHVRVFTDEENNFKPQIITEAIHLDLDGLDMEKVYELKDAEKTEELYKYLLIVQCNALNKILPGMFQKIADYTELLLPDNLLREGSVIQQMIELIPEDDWKDAVQIIGWLYQYYNSEKKDDVFAALKKNVKITKENIPAATQLFTPDWIVRYMVENSLGRLWLEGHPDVKEQILPTEEELSAYAVGNRDPEDTKWHYYLEEAEQEPEVQAQLAEIRKEYAALTPDQLKVIDPCSGSGHILAYMFDVLMKIYESYGYTTREAVASIVENNLYGLDIDDRAAQLAYFAVMMKARQYDRRFFSHGIQPHVYAIVESNHVDKFAVDYFCNGDMKLTAAMDTIIKELHDAKEYGSILTVTPQDWSALYDRFAEITEDINMSRETVLRELLPLVQVAEALAQKYDVVVTNPPYMGASNMNPKLNEFIKNNYTDYKSDFFSAFVIHVSQMTKQSGYCGFFTPYVWMFIQSYEKMRNYLYNQATIETLIQFEYSAFEEATVPVCTFAFQNRHIQKKGCYLRLVDFRGGMEVQRQKTLEAIKSYNNNYYYECCTDEFNTIPGAPLAYWATDTCIEAFVKGTLLSDIAQIKQGIKTGDNDQFVRLWYEVSINKTSLQNGKKWYPYNKGGDYRRWYGNNINLVNWENEGEKIKNFRREDGKLRSRPQNLSFMGREGLTYTDISSTYFGIRWSASGFIFDATGSMIFPNDKLKQNYLLGLLSSKVTTLYTSFFSPTIHFEVGEISRIPIIYDANYVDTINRITNKNIELARSDWDSFETSWDFKRHPLLSVISRNSALFDDTDNIDLAERYTCWENECNERFNQLKANEEELNRIFIDIYGLQDELTPEVEDKDVTVRKADLQRDIKSLISYAVGCMFGRYSLNEEGLVYAGGEWDDSKYTTFIPDADNIIPITDEEYLEDDIVSRFCTWLKTAFGAKSLETNMDFIARALGNKGDTSREIIRNYFLNDFFKDHCNTYSVTGSGKRPIYWLFDSGKQNGFKALVYLHRYNADTIGNVRVDYLYRMQRVYESEIGRMQDTIDNSKNSREVSIATKRKEKLQKQLKECREYDEKIGHLALARIELDLDDGVKANYRKVQTAADGKFYEILADSKNIMAKEK